MLSTPSKKLRPPPGQEDQSARLAASAEVGQEVDTLFMCAKRNRDQWLSIAKFLQAQKPSPQFKRKPTAAQKARAMVAALVRPESKA